jgi:hypothetical protein
MYGDIIIIPYHFYAGYLQLHSLNRIYRACSVAAIRPSQFVAHVILFPVLKGFLFYIIGPTFWSMCLVSNMDVSVGPWFQAFIIII